MKTRSIIFLLTLISICCISHANQDLTKSVEDKLVKVHSLKTKNGNIIGEVYVKLLNDTVFTDLHVINQTDTLYSIVKHILYSRKGKEKEVYQDGFYGYKFILKKDDYIVLSYLRNIGQNVSDDIVIEWNYDSKILELLKVP